MVQPLNFSSNFLVPRKCHNLGNLETEHLCNMDGENNGWGGGFLQESFLTDGCSREDFFLLAFFLQGTSWLGRLWDQLGFCFEICVLLQWSGQHFVGLASGTSSSLVRGMTTKLKHSSTSNTMIGTLRETKSSPMIGTLKRIIIVTGHSKSLLKVIHVVLPNNLTWFWTEMPWFSLSLPLGMLISRGRFLKNWCCHLCKVPWGASILIVSWLFGMEREDGCWMDKERSSS